MQSAVVSGNAEQVSSLVKYGVDINAKRGEYGTALIAAAQGAHKDVVKILLEYGAKMKECEARDNGCCQRILSIWNCSYYRRAVTSLNPYNLDRPEGGDPHNLSGGGIQIMVSREAQDCPYNSLASYISNFRRFMMVILGIMLLTIDFINIAAHLMTLGIALGTSPKMSRLSWTGFLSLRRSFLVQSMVTRILRTWPTSAFTLK